MGELRIQSDCSKVHYRVFRNGILQTWFGGDGWYESLLVMCQNSFLNFAVTGSVQTEIKFGAVTCSFR